ncbi:MAG: hypothetical protein J6P21_01555 [Clostridia bacterium]|nr:hypothetical protein [Clostridia bacterium]
MRIMYNASFVIMLVDILTKQPITDAVIFCNGKQNPYVTKDEGYYVFCNLYPGNYNIYIAATGYVSKEFSTDIKFGESKKFILELSFESRNPKIFNIPRLEFSIKKNKLPLKYAEINLILKTEIKSMKLIQQINPGDEEILLNIPEDNKFLLQKYIYSVPRKYLKHKKSDSEDTKDEEEKEKEKDEKNEDNESEEEENKEEQEDSEDKSKNKKEKTKEPDEDSSGQDSNENREFITQKMLFLGYDRKFNAYILEKKIPTDVPIGGSFFPYWNLKTDKYGKLILPFLRKLMTGTNLEFEISFGDQKKLIKANLNKFDINQKKLNLNLKVN